MIYILNKQQQIISTLSSKGDMKKVAPYFEDIHVEELDTGVETFEFKTLSNTKIASDIQVGNYVAFKDEDFYKIFQIKEVQEEHTEQIEKSVYCEGACLELLNEVIRPMTINSANLKQFLDTVLDGTSWSAGMIDYGINEVIHLDISDYENVYKIIQETVIEKFGGELRFRVEIANNRIISKNIDVFAKRGRVTNYRFEYGVNMTSVEKVVDSSELVTALIGVGKDNLTFKDVEANDKPKNQDFIANEEAYNRWNNNGSHIMGVFNCESESSQELLKLTRDELKRRSEPKITYNLEVELLGNDISLGDEVLVIDNEFIPPLHLSARVSVLEKSKTDKQSNRCTLSNFKEVKSNITSEMRELASGLAGKVDDKINQKFPISSEDIRDGAITEGKIESQYLSTVKADIVLAGIVETEKLIANKADITDLNATNAIISNLQANKADITDLNATNASIENLKVNKADIDLLSALEIKVDTIGANKADIDDLNAMNATISNLQANKANITDLNATNAHIENLKANKADIDSLKALEIKTNTIDATKATISDLNATKATISNLQANKAEITELNAVKGNIDHLTSEVADINTLVNGNLTSDNIHSLVLTSDKVTVEDAFIKNAMIDEIDANKISTGEINTGVVTIASPTGGITIANNTQQFKDKNNKVRVQIGEDKKGEFNFSIYDETGTGVLIDHTGVKEGALAENIIKENMISEDAVGEKQINYNSFATGFNKDTNTNTLKATKVRLDNTNQTLEVGFNQLKTQSDDTKSKTESNSTQLNVQQGQIQGLISDTTIEKDGQSIKIKDAYSDMEQTVDSFGVTIGDHTTKITQIDTKADNALTKATSAETTANGVSGRVTEVESSQSELKQNLEGFKSTVSKDYSTKAELKATNDKLGNVEGTVSNTSSKVAILESNLEGITQRVGSTETTTATLTDKVNNTTTEVANTNKKVSSIENNLNGISSKVTNLESTTATIDDKVIAHETRLSTAEKQIHSDSIIATVTSTIDQKIDKVTVGGRNLVRNSAFTSEKYWTLDSFAIIDSEKLLDNINSICLTKTGATSNNWGGIKQTVIQDIKKDDTLTVSGYYFVRDKDLLDDSFACELKGNYDGGSSSVGNYLNWNKDNCVQGAWTKFSYTVNATRDFNDAYLYGWISKNGEVWFAKLQVEKGNKVSDWTQAPEDVYDALLDTENDLKKDINNSIEGAKEGFLESAKENFTEKSEFNTFTQTVSSQFEQTSSDITAKFTESVDKTNVVNGKLEDFQETVTTHIQFDSNGINLGKTNSPFTATLDNTKLAFKQDGEEVAYISNNKMYITHAEIKDDLRIGKPDSADKTDGGFFTWIQGSKGNLSLKWSVK